MSVEKSVGAIIFRKEKGNIYYLLLSYPSISHRAKKNYWDFSKGHIEKGEEMEVALRREVEEETGLKNIVLLEGFKETIKYFFNFKNKNILKFVTFYLAEVKTKKIKISEEHIGYKWLSFKECLEIVSFKNTKDILKKADFYLRNKKNTLSLGKKQ